MKKLIALVLALAMVAVVGLASAATITITTDETFESGTGRTANVYSAYKIFDAKYTSLSGENSQDDKDTFDYPANAKVSYFMASGNPWIATVQGMTTYFNVAAAADGSGYTVTLKDGVDNDDTTAKAIANVFNTALTRESNPVTPTGDYAAKTITAGGSGVAVDKGYYLIKSATSSILALVTTDVTLVEKTDYPKLIKEFNDETVTGDFDAADDETTSNNDTVQVGDTVTYKLTVQIPTGANQPMIVTDTFTSGLDPVLENNVVKITTDFVGTPTVSAPASGKFTITLSATDVANNAGTTVYFTYQAVVTKDAWKADQTNTGKVKYGNDYETQPDHVDSNTYKLEIDKKAETEDGTDLGGAQFELYRTDTAGHSYSKVAVELVKLTDSDLTAASITAADKTIYYRVADKDDAAANKTTTIDMTEKNQAQTEFLYTKAVILGLDGDSTYSIRETLAPDGYNKLGSDIDVAMEKTNHLQKVVNLSGTTLPSTGGIGTTIFYVLGGLLVVGAAVILVARRKASN